MYTAVVRFSRPLRRVKSARRRIPFGLSTQDTGYQREAAQRLHLPFPLLSDTALKFAHALTLLTFTAAGMTLLKRMALVIDDGAIVKAFYPVFPPDRNAEEVLAWLRKSAA